MVLVFDTWSYEINFPHFCFALEIMEIDFIPNGNIDIQTACYVVNDSNPLKPIIKSRPQKTKKMMPPMSSFDVHQKINGVVLSFLS